MTRTTAILGCALLIPIAQLFSQQTRAERSRYTETSTHADVSAFIDSLQRRGAAIRVGSIGTGLKCDHRAIRQPAGQPC